MMTQANSDWKGPRTLSVLQDYNVDKTEVFDLVSAATADGNEQMEGRNFERAARSFKFALDSLDVEGDNKEWYMNLANVYLQSSQFSKADRIFEMLIEHYGDKPETYLIIHGINHLHGRLVIGVTILLRGMLRCNLCVERMAQFTVEASIYLSRIKLALFNGTISKTDKDYMELIQLDPTPPSTVDTWNRVVTTLLASRAMLALAYLTVGFPPDCHKINRFDGGCIADVDCSDGYVEDVYADSMSLSIIAKNNLARFLLKRGCRICQGVCGPMAVHISKLAIDFDCVDLVRLVLEERSAETLELDEAGSDGDTALHFLAKGKKHPSNRQALIKLLLEHGALPNLKNEQGKRPLDYIHSKKSNIHQQLSSVSKEPSDGFRKRCNALKEEGNSAFKSNKREKCIQLYSRAVTLIKSSEYNMKRELSILYSNMSAACCDPVEVVRMASQSKFFDPTYYKTYWRLGKCLQHQMKHAEACLEFLIGLSCADVEKDQNLQCQFIQELCLLLPLVPSAEMENMMSKLVERLTAVWPIVLDHLCKKDAWGSIRVLVLGPPTVSPKAVLIPSGWEHAGRREVGHLFSLDASSASFTTLCKDVQSSIADEDKSWIPDLVLALVLHGADMESLIGPGGEHYFYTAFLVCCRTGNLALMRYLLGDKVRGAEALCQLVERNCLFLEAACNMLTRRPDLDPSGSVRSRILRLFSFPAPAGRPVDCPPFLRPFENCLKAESAAKPRDGDCELRGDAEVEKGHFQSAIKRFSQAVTAVQLELKNSSLTVAERQTKNRGLAVLFCKRASCQLMLQKLDAVVEDARNSIACDKGYYEGHCILARTLTKQRKPEEALREFGMAYNTATVNDRKEILTAMVTTFVSAKFSAESAPFSRYLGYVPPLLWLKVTYKFYGTALQMAQICGMFWECALCANGQIDFSHLQDNILMDIKPLCTLSLPHLCCESLGLFIKFLIEKGSDVNRISVYPGDTYVHAASLMSALTKCPSLLETVIVKYAIPRREENMVDGDGDTVLHLYCKDTSHRFSLPFLVPALRLEMCQRLLGFGISPRVRNKDRLLPIDCVDEKESSLREVLRVAMFTEKPEKSDDGSVSLDRRRLPQSVARKTTESATSTSSDAIVECHLCKKNVSEAKADIRHKKWSSACSKLVKVLTFVHEKDPTHPAMVDESCNLLVDAIGQDFSADGALDVILSLPTDKLQPVLEGMAGCGKWLQLASVVKGANSNNATLGMFAEKMSILSFVKDVDLAKSPKQRVQMLKTLLKHGAQLPQGGQGHDLVKAAKSDFHFLEQLVELGMDPKYISVLDGDTPTHAALNIALELGKGNFGLLNKLLTMWKDDPERYPCLNVNSVDADGNTLLHVACAANYNRRSLRAVETLSELGIPFSAVNKDGKTAADLLTSSDNRRQHVCSVIENSAGQVAPPAGAEDKSDRLVSPSTTGAVLSSGKKKKCKGGNADSSTTAEADGNQELKSSRTFKKDALRLLGRLVGEMHQLSSEDVSLARENKGKWLDTLGNRWPPSSEDQTLKEDTNVEGEHIVLPSTAGDMPGGVGVVEQQNVENGTEMGGSCVMNFDSLPWEVECTASVWKTLRSSRLSPTVKHKIISSIHLLATGEWRAQLCCKVHQVPSSMKLYRAKCGKNCCIIWELAVQFSPRLSDVDESRLAEPRSGHHANDGRVYSEIIRVWDVVFDQDKLLAATNRIAQCHLKGENCLFRTYLKGSRTKSVDDHPQKRYPVLFSGIGQHRPSPDKTAVEDMVEPVMSLHPLASALDKEFHILKFYEFSTALVSSILQDMDQKVDFPFRVTDLEHDVISLRSKAPVLLLGRSGTGKTTCCLYRLWSRFLSYWTKSKEMDYAAFLPRGANTVVWARHSGADRPRDAVNGGGDSGGDGDRYTCGDVGMLATERLNMDRCNDDGGKLPGNQTYDHLHQVFVTKNQKLCNEVKRNFVELCHAHDVVLKHVSLEASTATPARLQDMDEYRFPLFLTSRQLWMLLDASLPTTETVGHFFVRRADGSVKDSLEGWDTSDEMFTVASLVDDLDEGDNQEDVLDNFHAYRRGVVSQSAGGDVGRENRREVTYWVFAHMIWPKIKTKSQVKYHPSLVWTEIVSFIKGSFLSLSQPKGYLGRDDYEKFGRKQAPNFSGCRDEVYDLFLAYNRYCSSQRFFDEADFVFNVYQRFQKAEPLSWVIHEISTDETQDFTQAELSMLITLCHNPNDMFFTGDTAQSIMRGVSFRFSDLKTIFHHAKQSLQNVGKAGPLEVPKKVFQLTHNYRSHAGILSLASAVLDLLVEFFPESFDRLCKDQGLFDGPQPIVLESCSAADLAILLSRNKRSTSHIEFGAHQAILVVSEEARRNLPPELSMGLVLTIFEAKGLEFDDILLYNFFKDSQASKEWRVVTDYLERLREPQSTSLQSSFPSLVQIDEDVFLQAGRPRPLEFDSNLHKILNSELKHLYTAVTRARVNVWIFDEDREKRAPMFEYCKARQLVKFISIHDCDDMSEIVFAESSDGSEWETRGKQMMCQRLYNVAAKCFAMAGNDLKENIATAFDTDLKAHQITNESQKRDGFLRAAVLFIKCLDRVELTAATIPANYFLAQSAGRCLQNAHQFELAAVVHERIGHLEVAARLFTKAQKWLSACRCYERMDNFRQAVRLLDYHELYDEAIDSLKRYDLHVQEYQDKGEKVATSLLSHQPDAEYTVDNLCYKAARWYLRYNMPQKMFAAIRRLPNPSDQIDFFRSNGLVGEAAKCMSENGQAAAAVTILLQDGKTDEAIRFSVSAAEYSLTARCYYVKAQVLIADQQENVLIGRAAGTTSEESDAECDGWLGLQDDETKFLPTEKACRLLKLSRILFEKCADRNGMGECSLSLALLQTDRDLLEQAFSDFSASQPVPNVAGMVEYAEVLAKLVDDENLDLQVCGKMILAIENIFKLVSALLHQVSPEESHLYNACFSLYGLESSTDGGLVVYPACRPRCLSMIPGLELPSKKDSRTQGLLFPTNEGVQWVVKVLTDRVLRWYKRVRAFMESQSPRATRCEMYMEGRQCDMGQACLNLHGCSSKGQTMAALRILRASVWLKSSFQSCVELLNKDENVKREVRQMMQQERSFMWSGVRSLIDFLIPDCPLTYHIDTGCGFLQNVSNKTINGAGCLQDQCVFFTNFRYPLTDAQMKRYLDYLWECPGDVARGKSDSVLKEHCKSSTWFVLASLLVPLFRLDINVSDRCRKLEQDLHTQRPEWIHKRDRYAVITEKDSVIMIARRHLDALEFLKPKEFNPFEAVIKFTKFVKLLSSRRRFNLIPEPRVMMFWMEVFSTVALFIAAKLRKNGHLALPRNYLDQLRLFCRTLPDTSYGQFMSRMEQCRSSSKMNLALLHDRIMIIMNMLCTRRFCLFNCLVDNSRRHSTVLAERVLILALTLMVNVEFGNSPVACSEEVLGFVHGIPDTKLPGFPDRLAELVACVRRSRSYKDVFTGLNHDLQSMDSKLQIYIWKWNPKLADAVISVDLELFLDKGFLSLLPIRAEKETMELVVDDVAVDEQTVQVEEEETSPEEKRRFEEQRMFAQQEERRTRCYAVIGRFFRKMVFFIRLNSKWQHRPWSLRVCCLRQLERELFSPFTVSHGMCGICGVSFCNSLNPLGGTELFEDGLQMKEEVICHFKQNHVQSYDHNQTERDFHQFRMLYRNCLSQPLLQIGCFLNEYEVKKMSDTWYSQIAFQVNRCTKQLGELRSCLDNTMQNRRWKADQDRLVNFCTDLKLFFMEARPLIETVFRQLKQTGSARPQGLTDGLRREGDYDDEQCGGSGASMSMIDVQDDPVRGRVEVVEVDCYGDAGVASDYYVGSSKLSSRRALKSTYKQYEHGDIPPRFKGKKWAK